MSRHFGTPLSVVTTPYAAPILQDRPDVRDIIADDGSMSAGDLGAALASRSFTHAVVFWSTARIASALRRARIPVRVGQARRLYSWSYTKRVTVRTENGDVTSHWTDVQMDYARALGATAEPGDFTIDIHPRAGDATRADAVLAAAHIAGPFAVLHAARGLDLDRVTWPTERFAAIGDAIASEFDLPVVLTGSAADASTIARISTAMRSRVALVAGKTDVMALAALLGRAALVVALDSGPMHIAAALGAPTVGIFALRTDLPDRWAPLGSRVAVVRPSYPCPTWHRKENCPDFACYGALSPAVVVDAARTLVPKTSGATSAESARA
ncbi:MAG TPA: glycosyltransferase family 9 protein [Candidatus Eremiobacteraceae bacterium]